MLFQNLSFILFCLVVFGLYWSLPKSRLWVLGVANACFYAAAGWKNLGLFLAASALTYVLGKFVTGERGRWALGLGILVNVANLLYFKYSGFSATTLMGLFPWLDLRLFTSVLLPIGISFYTFQHISYLVDRRYKNLEEAPSYLQFWVYISFFGHSIAGPIMRGHEFFPQIAETTRKVFNRDEFKLGLALFIWGLTKKVVIADRLAEPVNAFFKQTGGLTFGEAWSASLLFAFQIYYDFSAYSDMAVGIGLLFGYQLVQNFRTPYMSANASEFWTRWHVTLSSWIRDYVYIPLGGNRAGVGRAQLNLFLAMLVSGFWHGAAWTFIFWGAYHGLLLLGQRWLGALKARLPGVPFDSAAYRVVAIGAFFLLTTFGWVLFRATSLEQAYLIMASMVDVTGIATVKASATWLVVAAGLFALHGLEYLLRERWSGVLPRWYERTPAWAQGAVYAGLLLVMIFSYGDAQDFIYFQF